MIQVPEVAAVLLKAS
uniref:Uncharacterized protein n=1 Tax=Rhizophora mucronata TaxID=61149 RepID=A0A2P2NY96_RHIMU